MMIQKHRAATTRQSERLRHAVAKFASALAVRPRKAEIDPDDYETVAECIEDGNDPEECADVIEASAKGCACKTKADPAAKNMLENVTPHEVSIVDSAANRWELLMKMLAYRITKSPSGAKARKILGVVSEPGVADAHGDVMTRATVAAAKAAFDRSGCLRVQHAGACLAPSAARITSSRILAKAETIANKRLRPGTWLMELEVADPAIIAALDTGKLGGLSIGALASRSPIAKAHARGEMVWPAALGAKPVRYPSEARIIAGKLPAPSETTISVLINSPRPADAAPGAVQWGPDMTPGAVAKRDAVAAAVAKRRLELLARDTGIDATARAHARAALGVDIGNRELLSRSAWGIRRNVGAK